ncbi:helicase associated domain-containing protein [Streptomyces solincola]|uniref:helicase associated domain-containing protein n=1 Tax=Streptomyces solincola TaxID=2100817 RepID=UPI002AFE3F85|nr:helicase associated domain-containing protein [Streptomyces solincola]
MHRRPGHCCKRLLRSHPGNHLHLTAPTELNERFQESLEAAKAYYAEHWTLCAPRSATALNRPVGQWLANLRRPGALDGHPDWAAALEDVDRHWNPAWPAAWQRHYAAVRELLREEDGQGDVLPGVTVHGMDVGRWLEQQRQPAVWAGLAEEQRALLEELGVVPLSELAAEQPALGPAPGAAESGVPAGSFERGTAALAQYRARTGSVTVPRHHVERLADGTEVRLGVWLSNTKTRRAKLSGERLAALAALGLAWANF